MHWSYGRTAHIDVDLWGDFLPETMQRSPE